MLTLLLHILDWMLWLFLLGSVGYIVFFAFVSLFGTKRSTSHQPSDISHQPSSFLVVYPAYHEDTVIRQSVETFLQQDYPTDRYRLVVVSDHMTDATNEWLSSQPLTLLRPTFEKSSKARALQYAVQSVENTYDYIVILDADNVVQPDFLTRLNAVCQQGCRAIQCHRTAKNANNDVAALDGISEEINNTIFRRAHNAIGLSSALIGSGMCFDYRWFADHVDRLQTAVEDRELEALLLYEGIYVHYEADLPVMDEKVSSGDNFQRQRLRWMTGQVQSLLQMLPNIPHTIRHANINYIDKTIQQMLIPRSILLLVLPLATIVVTLLSWQASLKWWLLLLLFGLSLFVAIPRQLRSRALFSKALALPSLAWRMTKNLFHIERQNTDFLHTTHG